MAENRLSGINPLAYQGVEASSPPQFLWMRRDPTPRDYDNFNIGTIWLNLATQAVWMLVNLDNHVATWIEFDTGAGAATQYQTGDGLQAVPDAMGTLFLPGGTLIDTLTAPNVNSVTINVTDGGDGQVIIGQGANPPVWGDLTSLGGTIVITPNAPGHPNTINLEANNAGALTFVEDAGAATPAAGILNVLGDGVTIATAGAGNTITISEIAPGAGTTYITDAGNATPAANILNVVGDGVNTATAGAGNTVTVSYIGGGVFPFQSAFSYWKWNDPQGLVTGDGTIVTMLFTNPIFDLNGDFDGTYFTAPVNGVYFFEVIALLTRQFPSVVNFTSFLIGPGSTFTANEASLSSILMNGITYGINHSAIMRLNAGDQVYFQIQASGGLANNVGLLGHPTIRNQTFSGFLIG